MTGSNSPDEHVEIEEGTEFKVQIADGYGYYRVVDVDEPVSQVEHLPGPEWEHPTTGETFPGDSYRWNAVDGDGNILTSVLRQQLEWENTLRELASKGSE